MTSTSLPATALPRLLQDCDEELCGLRNRELLRTLACVDAIEGSRVRINGSWKACWCTNDYLGLSAHPRVIQAACGAAQRWGIGARASRLLAGTTQVHAQLEARLAAFFHTEAAVVFASGYLANLGALSTLAGAGDGVLVDRLAHASLIDACRASRATLRVFPHNDVDELSRLLARLPRHRRGRRLVVTEGVFSMDGDAAPLRELREVVDAHGALLYVDDAHGAFAVGETGRGSPERAGIAHEAVLYMGTLGKALGCQGGFLAGPRVFLDLLHNRARTFIYATALAVPVAAAAMEALRLIEEDSTPRARLARHVTTLHQRLASLFRGHDMRNSDRTQYRVPGNPSHIIPIIAGTSAAARRLSQRLWDRGIWAPAIRPPTVPDGTARLRLSVTALHTDEQLDQLVDALRDAR
ncbi:MAG: 8-amino-7-oxononanoate synthase [Candidatus Omnitrophica bacterium]|nr:8-amino-7-oxononanoate synthase [Candidatus Omnitrophota bacterium]